MSVLTDHQQTIARLVAGGNTNAQIADALSISPQTVKNNLWLIYTRLSIPRSANARVRLARWVWEAEQPGFCPAADVERTK